MIDPPFSPFCPTVNYGILKADMLNTSLTWFFLIFDIFFWYFAYIYLDSVMPDTYGIAKHPLFCLRKK
jgi:hypothetical protein